MGGWHMTTYTCEASKLYHLSPMNREGLGIESLTGYIARLAQKHIMDVGQLINYELVPILQKEYLTRIAMYGGTRFYNNASMINGIGQAAFDFVDALQKATLKSDLLNCTLYPWRFVIPTRGLIQSTKKWCPLCFHEALETEQEIYEPLLWSLQAVNACSIHGNILATKCPQCGQELRLLDRHSKPGHCNRCQKWLGQNDYKALATDYELVIARQAVKVLASFQEANRAVPRNIIDFFLLCSEKFSGGMAEFARFIGASKTTVWDWCKGKNLSPFPRLLAICAALKVQAGDVLLGNTKSLSIALPGYSEPVARLPKVLGQKLNVKKLQTTLENHMNSEDATPLSMKEIAKSQQTSRKAVERYFPALCKHISSKYLANKTEQAENLSKQRKIEIRNICQELIQQGIFPSRRNVEAAASWKAALRSPEIQEEWKSIVYGLKLST